MFVVIPTCAGEYLEECSRRLVKTNDLELCTFEMRWQMVVIRIAKQLLADMPKVHTGISALRAQSEQGVVYVVPCS